MEEHGQNLNPTPPVSSVAQVPHPQTPPVSNIEKPKSKLPFLIIGIILFLLVAGGTAGFYVFKQTTKQVACTMEAKVCPDGTSVGRSGPKCEFTPCPTADWKKYTNNYYHFSFNYPKALTFLKEDKSVFISTDFDNQTIPVTQYSLSFTTGKIIQSSDPGIKPMKDVSWIIINVTPTNGKTLIQVYDNKPGFGENKYTKVTMLDKFGNADEVANVSNIQNHIITIRKGMYFFDLQYPQDGSGEITSIKYLDQILSTFKFTDSQTVDTSNWKTYTGNGYTIKYPPNWFMTRCSNNSTNLNPTNQSCETEGNAFAINIIPVATTDYSFSDFRSSGDLKNSKSISLDGQNSFQAEIVSSPFEYLDTRIKVGNSAYDFILNDKGQREIYDQILSTFRFD